MDHFLEQLRERYGAGAVAVRDVQGATLYRISEVSIPPPGSGTTDVLAVVQDPRSARPEMYVDERARQPNGNRGKNVNPVMVFGESWLKCSWQFDWDWSQPAWALVEGFVRRFTMNKD